MLKPQKAPPVSDLVKIFGNWRRRSRRLDESRLERSKHRTSEELRWDVIIAFDTIEGLKMKIWILTGVIGAGAGTIGWLADHLFNCIDQAHQVARLLH
jgi:hypothetical protein